MDAVVVVVVVLVVMASIRLICLFLYLIECESVVIAFVILWEILVIDLLYNPGPLFDKGCL